MENEFIKAPINYLLTKSLINKINVSTEKNKLTSIDSFTNNAIMFLKIELTYTKMSLIIQDNLPYYLKHLHWLNVTILTGT